MKFKMRKGINLQDWINSVGEDAWLDKEFYQGFRMSREGYEPQEYPEALPDLMRRTVKLISEIYECLDYPEFSLEEVIGEIEHIKFLIEEYDPITFKRSEDATTTE